MGTYANRVTLGCVIVSSLIAGMALSHGLVTSAVLNLVAAAYNVRVLITNKVV